MDLRRTQFDQRQAQLWGRLCSKIGGRVVAGKWKGDKVQTRVDDWIITLDTISQSNGYRDTSCTRLRAPFFNPDGFQFNLYRAGFGTGLAKFLGTQDLEVGDPLFDEAFVLQSNHEPKARTLFARERIRDVLLTQPWGMKFSIQGREGRLESSDYPEGVHLLQFQAAGVVKDVDQLQSYLELFAEVLKRLRQLDAEAFTEVDRHLCALRAPGGRITSDHLVIWDGDTPRAAAAQRLGALKAQVAVPSLTAALAEPDPQLRANAAWALGEIGDPRASWDLIALLGEDLPDGMPRVSFCAATALRQLGHGAVVDALAAVLQGGGNGLGTLRRYESPE